LCFQKRKVNEISSIKKDENTYQKEKVKQKRVEVAELVYVKIKAIDKPVHLEY
jgi:hypothetical protein